MRDNPVAKIAEEIRRGRNMYLFFIRSLPC